MTSEEFWKKYLEFMADRAMVAHLHFNGVHTYRPLAMKAILRERPEGEEVDYVI